jgi:hypothetical protein
MELLYFSCPDYIVLLTLLGEIEHLFLLFFLFAIDIGIHRSVSLHIIDEPLKLLFLFSQAF